MNDFEAAWLAPIFNGVRLHFFGGSRDGTYLEIMAAGVYSLGRGRSSDISFSNDDRVDAMVSAEHAFLRIGKKGVTVGCRNPTNGLRIFDVEILAGREVRLRDGDLLRLGRGGPRVGVRISDLSALGECRGEYSRMSSETS